jgi:hypothetical protein
MGGRKERRRMMRKHAKKGEGFFVGHKGS